jgi:hypothetical protein
MNPGRFSASLSQALQQDFPEYTQGSVREGWNSSEDQAAGLKAQGLVEYPAGGWGSIWIKPDEAAFLDTQPFGVSHLNGYALHAYQLARKGQDPEDLRDRFVDELVNNLDEDEGNANRDFDDLRAAAWGQV